MDADRAQALAEALHKGQADAGGAPLIAHVRRVASAVLGDARPIAWLHEVLESTLISEESLLGEGLSVTELRALRLLARDEDSRSTTMYLAHIELIARASGPGGAVARRVKRADLADRVRHPAIRADGWAPPYDLGLEVLRSASPPFARAEPGSLSSHRLLSTDDVG